MNKDLKNVLEQVGRDLWAHTYCFKIESLIKDCGMYQPEEVDSLIKYREYSIFQIIELIRIERLFDLKLISLEDMKILLEEYKEYKELSSKIVRFSLDQFSGKISNEEKIDKKLCLREKELENKLKYFGILGDFNFEEAILNDIDKNLEKNEISKKIASLSHTYYTDENSKQEYLSSICLGTSKLWQNTDFFAHADLPDGICNQEDENKNLKNK